MAIKTKIPCPRCDAQGVIPRYYYNRKGICFLCWGDKHIYVKVPEGKDRDEYVKELKAKEKQHLDENPPKVAMPDKIKNKAYDKKEEKEAHEKGGGSSDQNEKPKSEPKPEPKPEKKELSYEDRLGANREYLRSLETEKDFEKPTKTTGDEIRIGQQFKHKGEWKTVMGTIKDTRQANFNRIRVDLADGTKFEASPDREYEVREPKVDGVSFNLTRSNKANDYIGVQSRYSDQEASDRLRATGSREAVQKELDQSIAELTKAVAGVEKYRLGGDEEDITKFDQAYRSAWASGSRITAAKELLADKKFAPSLDAAAKKSAKEFVKNMEFEKLFPFMDRAEQELKSDDPLRRAKAEFFIKQIETRLGGDMIDTVDEDTELYSRTNAIAAKVPVGTDPYTYYTKERDFTPEKRAKFRIAERAAAIAAKTGEDVKEVAGGLMAQIDMISIADEEATNKQAALLASPLDRVEKYVDSQRLQLQRTENLIVRKQEDLERDPGNKAYEESLFEAEQKQQQLQKALRVGENALAVKRGEEASPVGSAVDLEKEAVAGLYGYEIQERLRNLQAELGRVQSAGGMSQFNDTKEKAAEKAAEIQERIRISNAALAAVGDDGTLDTRNRMVRSRYDMEAMVAERGKALTLTELDPVTGQQTRVPGKVTGISQKDGTITIQPAKGSPQTRSAYSFDNATPAEADSIKVDRPAFIPSSSESRKADREYFRQADREADEILLEATKEEVKEIADKVTAAAKNAGSYETFRDELRKNKKLAAYTGVYGRLLLKSKGKQYDNDLEKLNQVVYNNTKPAAAAAAEEKPAADGKKPKSYELVSEVGPYQVTTRIHTKTGETLYAIEPKERVDMEEFKSMMKQVKQKVGGFYDRKVFKRHLTNFDPTDKLKEWLKSEGKKIVRSIASEKIPEAVTPEEVEAADRAIRDLMAKGVNSEQDAVQLGRVFASLIEPYVKPERKAKAAKAKRLGEKIKSRMAIISEIDKANKLFENSTDPDEQAQYAQNMAAIDKLGDEVSRLYEEKILLDEPLMKSQRQLFTLLSGYRSFGTTKSFKVKPGGDATVINRMHEALEVLPTEWGDRITQMPIKMVEAASRSGYSVYKGFSYDDPEAGHEIQLTRSSDISVAAHESMHIVEHASENIRNLIKEFYDRRTAGSGSVFEDGGEFKDGGFLRRYMGKRYPNGGHEAVTTGIEALLDPSYEDLTLDADHYYFVLGILLGGKI